MSESKGVPDRKVEGVSSDTRISIEKQILSETRISIEAKESISSANRSLQWGTKISKGACNRSDLEAVMKQMGITNAILVMIPAAVTSTTIEQTGTPEKLVPPKVSIPPKRAIPTKRRFTAFKARKIHQSTRRKGIRERRGTPHGGNREGERENTPVVS